MARCRATHLGREPKPDPHSRRFYLLSLDGGGVRGLSSLYVLKGLMVRLNDQRQSIGLARVKPCEVFDLIGGTGTGG
jgi:patatin-like phospholipase/acyl hydrolase